MTTICGLFFDLGKTLIYPKSAWHPIMLRAHKSLTNSLTDQGIGVDRKTFPYEFAERLNKYYVDRETTLREISTLRLLENVLNEKGFRNTPASTLRIALDAFYAITQQNWHLEADAHETLRKLKLNGYTLALLSNAADDKDVHTLINNHNLRPYFSFIRTSAEAGCRKPHRQLFEDALNALNLFPQQCAMIGDTLDADIKGANKLGIHSVWLNRRVNKETKTLIDIHPKTTIQKLSELPQLFLNIS